jgi:CubicO group peptidase (beta-lactamase class C family)
LAASACSAFAQLNPDAVRAAAAYSNSRNGASLLIVQGGNALHEQNANESRKIYSGTKAFWCLAALAAAQDGLLSLDERVADTIPEWRNDPRKSRVTIRQLLDFSAGLEQGLRLHRDDPGDRDAIALKLPHVAEPGSAFIYGPSQLQVFHAVLKAKLGGKAPHAYLERRVLGRLGLGRQRYLKDSAGQSPARGWLDPKRASVGEDRPACGEGRRARRVSRHVRERGPRLVRESGLQLRLVEQPQRAGGREFDFEAALTPKWHAQSWGNAAICNAAPSDLVMCVGSRYQRLYAIPSLGLVVVRHGDGGTFSDARFLRLLLGRER